MADQTFSHYFEPLSYSTYVALTLRNSSTDTPQDASSYDQYLEVSWHLKPVEADEIARLRDRPLHLTVTVKEATAEVGARITYDVDAVETIPDAESASPIQTLCYGPCDPYELVCVPNTQAECDNDGLICVQIEGLGEG